MEPTFVIPLQIVARRASGLPRATLVLWSLLLALVRIAIATHDESDVEDVLEVELGPRETYLHLSRESVGSRHLLLALGMFAAMFVVGIALLLFFISRASDETEQDGNDPETIAETNSKRVVMVEHSDDEGTEVVNKDGKEVVNCSGCAGAIAAPNDEAQLEALLQSEGIDTLKWGKSIPKLLEELTTGYGCLTYAQTAGQPKRLVRRLRLLLVRIAASLPTGLHTLKTVRAGGNIRNKYQNCAKKIRVEDDVNDELSRLLLQKVSLPVDLQREHLQVVYSRTTMLNSRGGERGTSFPGLTSLYLTEEVWVKILDASADDIAGTLPCEQAVFQIKGGDGEARPWEWTAASEFERGTFERAPQAAEVNRSKSAPPRLKGQPSTSAAAAG